MKQTLSHHRLRNSAGTQAAPRTRFVVHVHWFSGFV